MVVSPTLQAQVLKKGGAGGKRRGGPNITMEIKTS